MHKLTLVIPAKNEKESLPKVLEELKDYNLEIIIVLEENDKETIQATTNYKCKTIFQKNKGYGDALLHGINNVQTKFFCIFNADGSFNPIELREMYEKLNLNKADFIFASRYEKNCSSDDDTVITYIGNFIFTRIGNIFFNLKITDILYTFVAGSTDAFKKLNIKSKDFSFCIEFPIKANRMKFNLLTSKSHERARIGGKKKVNAFRDGLKILISMIAFYFVQ
tara:strand:+ start:300 stop:968 length:669 start_codon:yes stop_codon:yes gene_type:complete